MNNENHKTAAPLHQVVGQPSNAAVRYADYILNHYARNSQFDKIVLARDLERHGWRPNPKVELAPASGAQFQRVDGPALEVK